MKSFVQKLNLRLIVIHFLAICLIICVFKVLAYLKDFDLVNDLRDRSSTGKHFDANRVANFLLLLGLSGIIGLLVAFVASLTISIKNNWYWVNSLISFVGGFFYQRLKSTIGSYNPVWYFKYLFGNKVNLFVLFIFSILFMTCIALYLLFNKRVKRFIGAGFRSPAIFVEKV